jgi:hypothetical protein
MFDSARRVAVALDVWPAVEELLLRKPDDSATVCCVKDAAAVHFGVGCPRTAGFAATLPAVLRPTFAPQKLALAFTALKELLAPRDTGFVWTAIVAIGHGSADLRCAALPLLARALPAAVPAPEAAFAPAIARFEAAIGASFARNFAHAFMLALTRSLQDSDTRQAALHCARTCAAGSRACDRAFFLLPAIAFEGRDECEFFRQFEAMDGDDRKAAIAYLAQEFGERHCAQGVGLVADCLIRTAKKHTEDFAAVRADVMEKCWRLLQTEGREGVIAKISELYAISLVFQGPDVEPMKLKAVEHLADDVLNSLLLGMIDHIAVS